MDDAISLGPRIRSLRLAHGMTQAELARRASVSEDLVSRLERGSRRTARLTTIMALAAALDEDPGTLTGKGNRVHRVGDSGVLDVRNAISSPDLLPGMDPEDDDEPSDPARLWSSVERAYGAYFAGEFGVLASTLPGLLSECRVTRNALGPRAVAAAYAHACQLAACLMVHTGRDDAALLGAARGLATAEEGDDEFRSATLRGTYVWILLRMGRYEDAERLALRAAETIEPTMSCTDMRQVTAWGGLMLHAAVTAGGASRGDEALEYLALARSGARHLDHDRHDYWVSFGPSQVAMQEAHIHIALDEPSRALSASRNVHRGDLYKISWARHRLNDAHALIKRRKVDEAVNVATEAYNLSPEWFRHQKFAASVVTDMIARKTRLSGALQVMASAVAPAE
ncbi:helix-turn-helix transcriptional regulator [Spiractinospora alimapuensis]|uniref:helix-turn-helix domain-containing protein n=1 Tax=Spiractinospora alimapuensis TaxID=2820884 RepID=UPI001F29DD36|nr:helix-turn-helix transcriptional regulator [Spiractinospora alimapuensis]QVQ52156.1 helix-turn-helix transcriptional regulator [Spiractinospora alimapuensis]